MPADRDTLRFEQLYDRHAAELLRYCFRRTADAALAEDLVAIVFLEAWRGRDRLPPADGARPWLYGIATNVVRQQWRGRLRHAAALRRIGAQRTDAEAADEAHAREEEMRAVLAAVAALPRRERDVLALCVWSEMSYEDAAKALGVPVGTVRSRLSRARARLRSDAAPSLAPSERTSP